MSVEKITEDWKKKIFKPIYLFHGEEDYYIDLLVHYAENNLLSEAESSFNLTVFYGKDAEWSAVINACKRYPMFAEKQVVILKEAQQMNALEKLEPYFESPLDSTIFIIGYKTKSFDKRTRLYKLAEKKGVTFLSSKIREDKIHEWITALVKSKGFTIDRKSAILLEEHLGNDLSRISNEIDKISINLKDKKNIDEDDIERFVGISKEYNIFELQAALAFKDLPKSIKIISYFESNPKAVPIQLALPALYSFFSKVYSALGLKDQSERGLMPHFYNNPIAARQAHAALKNYGYEGIEKVILLLNHYNLKSLGVGDIHSSDAELLREMAVKMII